MGRKRKEVNLKGLKFGKLTALRLVYDKCNWCWRCRCECGEISIVREYYLLTGHTKSCGCGRGGRYIDGRTLEEEYDIWYQMCRRCSDTNAINYNLYGGRGIKVCERWKDYRMFVKDMGKRPSEEHSVERLDNDGDYNPENCIWATRKQQSRNTRNNVMIEAFGQRKCLMDWAEEYGMPWNTLETRLRRLGWEPERAISQPVRYKRPDGYRYGIQGKGRA